MTEQVASKSLLSRFAAFVFYGSILSIVYLATTKQVAIIQVSHFDKVQHLAAFGWLTLFAYLAWRQLAVQRFAIIFLISLGIEMAQVFISYRSASWLDLVANGAGIICAEIIIQKAVKPLVHKYSNKAQS